LEKEKDMHSNGRKFLFTALFLSIIATMTITTGCRGKNEVTPEAIKPSSQSINTTVDTSEPLDERYKENPELIVADIYAGRFGITPEEALQRFSISDAFSGLGAELETGEPETFAGLWIQHEPTFRIAIAFTRGGEETVEKYVSENLTAYVEVRTAKYSLAELESAQNEVITSLRNMGIPFCGGIDVINNHVDLDVTDRTEIDNVIKEGRLTIPGCVEINIVEGFPVLL
jgi:hypothetical protein